MPVPLITNSDSVNTFSSLIESVQSRIEDNACLASHAPHEPCVFHKESVARPDDIVIHIVQKNTNILLERWEITIHERPVEQYNDTVNTVSTHARQLPLCSGNRLDFYSVIYHTHTQCYSYHPGDSYEFRKSAHLKMNQFGISNISVKVVHDDAIELKTISLTPATFAWKINSPPPPPCSSSSPFSLLATEGKLSPSHIPIVSVRRLSRLSISALQIEDDDDDEHNDEHNDNHPTPVSGYHGNANKNNTIPIPSPRMQYTHHGNLTAVAYSTSPTMPRSVPLAVPTASSQRRNSFSAELLGHKSLVGSYEESLLSGRMSSMPSKPITFHCQLGVLGRGSDCKSSLKCPPHWSIVFPAMFYELQSDEPIPYVGTIDLQDYAKERGKQGYRIPPKGQIQVVIKNPNKTAVKLFLIPYDFTEMPPRTKTFLRQKSYTKETPHLLRYAIHVQICKTEKNRIYLYKTMRVVFANRMADAREKFKVVCEGPKEPTYIPL
ncbi:hypothetical protein K501DRAFT_284197 [Backusella circina FSU 941]|nr:hypothetical protein K501DRAFT_284197 [Backusella circina FSU 941]